MIARRFRSADWDEPLVMEMGAPGRRGYLPPAFAPELSTGGQVPESLHREALPDLPELSEFEVERHYLHLAQETLGMMGVSLFGTCTMKYNPRAGEAAAARVAEIHPGQDEATLQGVLEVIHRFDALLQELSGMDRFVFQPGGGADAAYTHACVTRAYHEANGELDCRDEVITTIQSHPCNAATAAAAGFKVITLMIDESGYAPFEALVEAVSDRTAAVMVGNPDDMGIYNPEIRRWVDLVHDAGGLCFYDHANFNGMMSRIRARELGFDACMFMLHKTFGAPKGAGGPAVGAYGCSAELEPFMPRPLVRRDGDRYRLEDIEEAPSSIGRVREYWGNVPQVIKAYGWTRGMGADGIRAAADLSVLANNYMEGRLLKVRGLTKSHPDIEAHRLEMTRYSLGDMTEATGVTVVDVQNRMADFGVDAPWLSHEPWLVPEPITPEAGELWSLEDIDYWIDVLAHVCNEAYESPETVKSAPHNHAIKQLDGSRLDEHGGWATTWRAYRRKNAGRDQGAAEGSADGG